MSGSSLWLSHKNLPFHHHVCYMPCPFNPPLLDHCNYIWLRVEVMKILIMQISPSGYYFIPLHSKYSPQHTILKHPQPMFLPNVRDQVSIPYKTRGKIIV
jgi:hypothetical protein